MKIAVLAGDGIGPEVMAEGLKVLHAVRDDVETLRRSELIPSDIQISGAIYDVWSGEIREVVRA